MKYLVLLFGDEATMNEPGTPEFDAEVAEYARFDEQAGDAVAGGAALHPTSAAVTIRCDSTGSPIVADGPFAESVEAIGGFYVLEAADLDEALGLAQQLPAARLGAVEVRPMVEWAHREPESTSTDDDGSTRDQYLALMAWPESEASIPGTPAWDEGAAEHGKFAERAGGAIVSGGALHPAATATTVRVRDDETVLSDGPFIESAEVIGGVYVLAAADHDEAVRVASMIPIGDGAVELRPIIRFD